MANPQVENGYTRVANEILEAICKTPLSDYESRVIHALWRKTYGFSKKEDWISYSQLMVMTGLRKQHLSRTKTKLLSRKIVTQIGYSLSFNKNYEEWLDKDVVTNLGITVTQIGYKSNPNRLIQKKLETNTKEKDLLVNKSKSKTMKKNTFGSYNENNSSDNGESVIDLDSGNYVNEPKKMPKNKTALEIIKIFSEMCEEKLKVKPMQGKGNYFIVLSAMKVLKPEKICELFEVWFTNGKPKEDLIQITQALSINNINRYLTK